MGMEIWELIKTVEFSVPLADNSELLEFRIELFRNFRHSGNLQEYQLRAFRYDTFGTSPLFAVEGLNNAIPHRWPVVDTVFDRRVIQEKSCDSAMDYFLGLYSEKFGLEIYLQEK